MDSIDIIREKVATAEVDVHLVGGKIICKGRSVNVALKYSKDWPFGGFRTHVEDLGFTNPEAFYECFD